MASLALKGLLAGMLMVASLGAMGCVVAGPPYHGRGYGHDYGHGYQAPVIVTHPPRVAPAPRPHWQPQPPRMMQPHVPDRPPRAPEGPRWSPGSSGGNQPPRPAGPRREVQASRNDRQHQPGDASRWSPR